MGLFAAFVVAFIASVGGFSWRDPYFQTPYTDYTLIATPFLAAGVFLYLWLFVRSELRKPPYATLVPTAAE